MYPSSSSSSSHSSVGPSGGSPLFRYGSAPGSLFTAAVDSVIGQHHRSEELSPLGPPPPPRYFSSETSSESNNKTATGDPNKESLQRSYGLNDGVIGNRNGSSLSSSSPSPLVRHSSSPAGFLNRLASSASAANGFSVTRGIGSYNSKGGSDTVSGIQRLNSQLSFTRQDSLSQITEESEDGDDDIHAENKRKSAHSYATANFGMGSWDNSSTIMFSAPPGRRAKSDISGLNIMEAQFDLASVEHMIDIPQDSVTCKARAKRGCATHPRSIAERERRTRISGKLKKLQDLVPNMDKQTSYADMLDLAVQHIKGLQTQVQLIITSSE